MKKRLMNLLPALAVVFLSLCVLTPLLVNGWFDRPSADDYDYAVYTHQALQNGEGLPGVLLAALRTVGYFYRNWQGTYTSAFLMSLQPGIWGEKVYRLTPVIILGLMFLTLWGSFSQLNRRLFKQSRFFPAAAAMTVLALFTVHMPSASEGLYWYNGAIHYLPPMTAGLLCAVSSWDAGLRLSEGKGGRGKLVLCCILSLLISGTSYISVLFNLMLLAGLCAFQWKQNRKPWALIVLLFALAGFAISAMAPGTAIRQGNFEQLGIAGSILTTLRLVLESVSYLFSFQWALAMLAAVPAALLPARRLPEEKLPEHVWGWILYSAAIYCGLVCVMVYSTGFTENIWPGRCRNALSLGFLLLTWGDLFLLTAWARGKGFIRPAKPSPKALLLTAAALLLSFLPGIEILSQGAVSATPVQVLIDYHYARPVNYVIQADARFARLNDPSLTEVAVEPLKVTETMVFFSDITEEYEDLLSRWYGKKVTLTEGTESVDPLDPFGLGQ